MARVVKKTRPKVVVKKKTDYGWKGPAAIDRWSDENYVKVYDLARIGLAKTQVAKKLGVSFNTFLRWCQERPALVKAFHEGSTVTKRRSQVTERFFDYCYKRLPPRLQKTWNRIMDAWRKGGGGFKEVNKIWRRLDTRLGDELGHLMRQQLYVHAMVYKNFNAAEASRTTGIDYTTYLNWRDKDPKFAEMMDVVRQMQKDFGEGALMSLVGQGDTTAVLFFNRTINKDRGYDPKTTVDVNVGGKVLHGHVKLDDIMDRLPLEKRVLMLQAVRELTTDKEINDG